MIIRIQAPNGMKRIECDQYDATSTLYQKAQQVYDLDDLFGFKLYKDAGGNQLILMHERKCLIDFSLKHGDVVYLLPCKDSSVRSSSSKSSGMNIMELSKIFKSNLETNTVRSDDVDLILMKQNGLIEKKLDHNLCNHGPNTQCVHCAPIEPYDEEYMKEHNIKHMSFHSYLRKLQRGVDKGKFVCFEDVNCKIKPGCKGHPPWPQGICTKCQPSAITLNRQPYRHVDNVTFENTSIVENFLNYWRITGNQRFGFLYGYYEPYKEVPLGIRAVVVGIYEPPQESTRDSIKLHLERLDFKDVDYVVKTLGYKRLGWIFTDLIPEEKGNVAHIRGADSYFLTAQECIMAGFFQYCHPNPCWLAKSGYFGSKFVSVCVTGDKDNQVHMEAYQVSNQCMALVRDECLVPTNVPELAYVCESDKDRYVPDVFYKEKDKYGNEVSKIARPLPIEYLLVDVPVSAPKEQVYTFNPLTTLKPFPVENRLIEGHLQDFHALSTYLKQFGREQFLEAVSDFHLLIYLAAMDTVSLREPLQELLVAIKNKDRSKAIEWSNRDCWSTVEQLMRINSDNYNPSQSRRNFGEAMARSSSSGGGGSTSSNSAPGARWSCNYCTFENEGRNASCEICNLPK